MQFPYVDIIRTFAFAIVFENAFPNASAPRTPNFNARVDNFHGFVSTNPLLENEAIGFIDQIKWFPASDPGLSNDSR